MFAKDNTEQSALETAITRLLADMAKVSCDSDEYAKLTDQLSKLYKMKEVDAKIRRESSNRVSPDTLALIAANLTGIVMILSHERMNVIGSKALSFVSKLR